MYCQKCDAENPDDAHRCLSCGYEFAHVSAAAATVTAKTSGVAIAALVLGILAFVTCGITALPAIICGIVALVKISGSNGLLKGKGMAITGLVLSAVFVVLLPVLGIFAAIFMPAFTSARDQAQSTLCMSKLKQLSIATFLYTEDNDGQFPTASEWCDLVFDYTGSNQQIFRCPTAPEGIFYGYAFNRNLDGVKLHEVDPQTVMIFEADGGWNKTGGADMATFVRHGRPGCNVGFADGHVEFVPAERISELKWKPNE
jgi:prepilin-type processing-associated H-X9-DG protein